MKEVTLRLVGTTPLLLHNGRLVDPLDEYSKQIKKLSGKRQKTEAEHEELGWIEFQGGLYWNEEVGVVIPTENIEATIKQGARLSKKGKMIERGFVLKGMEVPLAYTGPRTQRELYEKGFKHRKAVKIGQSKLMRTRPMFQKWALEAEAVIDSDVLDLDVLQASAEAAGKYIGLCDYRPRFGRFEVTLEK